MGSITRGIANNILGNGAVDGTDALSGTIPANNVANASLSNLTAFPPSVSAGIPQVASDPPSPTEGDVWYNTTTYKLKVRGLSVPAGSWASGGDLNTARYYGGGAGPQTSNISVGGLNPSGYLNSVETYNGSSWSNVTGINTTRLGAGVFADVNTAALAAGGEIPAATATTAVVESWNGSAWTEVNDLNTARYAGQAQMGNPTAAILAGGNPAFAVTESWNGTSWTEVNDLNTARGNAGSAGTTTSAIVAGSTPAPPNSETWDGTSWTITSSMSSPGSFGRKGGGTSSSSAIMSGSNPTPTNFTEYWDGTSWTEVAEMATARNTGTGGGTATAAIYASGGTPGVPVATTEEWTATGDGNLNVTLTQLTNVIKEFLKQKIYYKQ